MPRVLEGNTLLVSVLLRITNVLWSLHSVTRRFTLGIPTEVLHAASCPINRRPDPIFGTINKIGKSIIRIVFFSLAKGNIFFNS
jgi:hypothetical protein